jgi:hypothetical protein
MGISTFPIPASGADPRIRFAGNFKNAVLTKTRRKESGEIILGVDPAITTTVTQNSATGNGYLTNIGGGNLSVFGQRLNSAFSKSNRVSYVDLYALKVGSPPNLRCDICKEVGSSIEVLASLSLPHASFTAGYTLVRYDFSNIPHYYESTDTILIRFTQVQFNDTSYYNYFSSSGNPLAESNCFFGTTLSITEEATRDLRFTVEFARNALNGTIIKKVKPNSLYAYDKVHFKGVLPANTSIVCDVLSNADALLLSNVADGGSISSINPATHPQIKLRWTLSRNASSDGLPILTGVSWSWLGTGTTQGTDFSQYQPFSFVIDSYAVPANTTQIMANISGGGYVTDILFFATSVSVDFRLRITLDGNILYDARLPNSTNGGVGIMQTSNMGGYWDGSQGKARASITQPMASGVGSSPFANYPYIDITTNGLNRVILLEQPLFFEEQLLIEIVNATSGSYNVTGGWRGGIH